MKTTAYIQKWDGSYLLTITVSKAGHPSYGIELVINKSDWEELKKMGINDLSEESE